MSASAAMRPPGAALVEDPAELREAARLGDHEPPQLQQPRLHHLRELAPREVAQVGLEVAAVLQASAPRLDRVAGRVDRADHDLREQSLLVGEVLVDGLLRHARRARRSRPCWCRGSRCAGRPRSRPRGSPGACGRSATRPARVATSASVLDSPVPIVVLYRLVHGPSESSLPDHVTLDGVMQGPGGRDEDTRGGLRARRLGRALRRRGHGRRSWAEGWRKGGALLWGRRTYEQFSFWPKQTETTRSHRC